MAFAIIFYCQAAQLGHLGGQLGHLGGQLGHLGGQLGHLGGQLGHLGGHLGHLGGDCCMKKAAYFPSLADIKNSMLLT